jgi:hypothetical protein
MLTVTEKNLVVHRVLTSLFGEIFIFAVLRQCSASSPGYIWECEHIAAMEQINVTAGSRLYHSFYSFVNEQRAC